MMTFFGNLFKQKKFYEIPNAVYRGWLGFKIAALALLLPTRLTKRQRKLLRKKKRKRRQTSVRLMILNLVQATPESP